MLTQVFAIASIAALVWVFAGYSLAFTNGGGLNDYVGGFLEGLPVGRGRDDGGGDLLQRRGHSRIRLSVLPDDLRDDHPALIVGAFAERMKFSALILFAVLWLTFIYFPIAHMVWYWAGPT